MDGLQKLAHFNQYMGFEVTREDRPGDEGRLPCANKAPFSEKSGGDAPGAVHPPSYPIYMAAANGKRVPILKTVLTSACERNCRYCAFSARRNYRRVNFTPQELAVTVDKLHRAKLVTGAFLSSGVAGGGVRTQDRLLETAEILRLKLGFRGYMHLKIMPGAERAQVERALELADRVSVNLEAPTTARLHQLAPQKVFLEELLKPLQWVEEIRRNLPPYRAWKGRWPSSSTQFVVGGAGESDQELLKQSAYLHRALRLKRVYFSGFSPVAGTPMENQSPVNPVRVHRLYQAAFLLRDYGFGVNELGLDPEGQLSLEQDPKFAWAQKHLRGAPVELNRADFRELLRVPGIGPKGAKIILAARRQNKLRYLKDLKQLGIHTGRAAPFILLDGHHPSHQLTLW